MIITTLSLLNRGFKYKTSLKAIIPSMFLFDHADNKMSVDCRAAAIHCDTLIHVLQYTASVGIWCQNDVDAT